MTVTISELCGRSLFAIVLPSDVLREALTDGLANMTINVQMIISPLVHKLLINLRRSTQCMESDSIASPFPGLLGSGCLPFSIAGIRSTRRGSGRP